MFEEVIIDMQEAKRTSFSLATPNHINNNKKVPLLRPLTDGTTKRATRESSCMNVMFKKSSETRQYIPVVFIVLSLIALLCVLLLVIWIFRPKTKGKFLTI
jgi:hypothetical protein